MTIVTIVTIVMVGAPALRGGRGGLWGNTAGVSVLGGQWWMLGGATLVPGQGPAHHVIVCGERGGWGKL